MLPNHGDPAAVWEKSQRRTMKYKATYRSSASLRTDYLREAAWYYYRALDNDENLVCALHRMQAEKIGHQLARLGQLPTAEEIHAYAAGMFPADRLHSI